MLHWEILLHPAAYAQVIVAHPPLGATTLLLLGLTAVWALTGFCMYFYLRRSLEPLRETSLRLLAMLTVMPLALLAVWLMFTVGALGIARWLGHTLSFETLFCLLVVSAAPQSVTWVTYPLRETAIVGLYAWRTLASVLLLWTTLRVLETLGAAAPLPLWHSLLVATPFLLTLWSINLLNIGTGPKTVRAACPWRRAAGKRVVLFYRPGKVAAEMQRLAWDTDVLVAQIERILDVKPMLFRVRIFLCDDTDELRRLSKVEERCREAYDTAGHILGVCLPWRHVKAILARRLTDIVVRQRLTPCLMPLLEEGLAECAADWIAGKPLCAAIRLPMSLSTLAHSGVFYEPYPGEEATTASDDATAHAAALADYLIRSYGMDKFKALCRLSADNSKRNPAARLHQAVGEVYGLSVRQLEQNWRREWIGPDQIQLSPDLPDS